jgi:sulfate adenylyltransferase subunit 2
VFPLSNWTELDIWQYIRRESIEIVPLYFAAPNARWCCANGVMIMVDDDRMPLKTRRDAINEDGPLSHARLLPADRRRREHGRHADGIIQEMLLTTTSERQGRVIDHDQSASMEKKKQEGYF